MVVVLTQFVVIRSSGVFVCMCALTQHWYAVPGSNPLTWTLVVLLLMLGTLTSWICPCGSDSDDVVQSILYPLMFLSLGIDCSAGDQIIIIEVEFFWTEMFCGDGELFVIFVVALCH